MSASIRAPHQDPVEGWGEVQGESDEGEVTKFERGQRVVMTVLGYERLVKPWARRASERITLGTVVRCDESCVVVLRDGLKCPRHYHQDFWEAAQ